MRCPCMGGLVFRQKTWYRRQDFPRSRTFVVSCVAPGENDSRVRDRTAARNLAILRKIAINLISRDRTPRVSIRTRRKQAAWNDDYMLSFWLDDFMRRPCIMAWAEQPWPGTILAVVIPTPGSSDL